MILSKREVKSLENLLPGIVLKVYLSTLYENNLNEPYKEIARINLWAKLQSLFYHETSFNISVRFFESKIYKNPYSEVLYKTFYLCYSYEDISNFELNSELEEFLEWNI